MNRSALASILFLAWSTVANAESKYILQASFPDGTGLEILTQTTGSTPIAATGEMGIGPGVGSQDLVNRIVLDQTKNILFIYNLEASRGDAPGTVKIRIEPISAATEAILLRAPSSSNRPPFSGAHLPTVAGVRDFPSVKIGEAVALDILYNPATGEKIYDVIRPIPSFSPHMLVTSAAAQEMISLKQIAVRVNGKLMPAPASWLIGAAVRIDIPHHGAYVVATRQPVGHEFAQIARADGKFLIWTIGHDRVEIASGTNVLTQAGSGLLWIYQDTHYQPDVLGLQSADTVDWLLPKR